MSTGTLALLTCVSYHLVNVCLISFIPCFDVFISLREKYLAVKLLIVNCVCLPSGAKQVVDSVFLELLDPKQMYAF